MSIKLLDESISTRLDTLERDIKSKSNSFYDSYLDLLEGTIKYILDETNIEYDDSRTCGYLVKEKNINDFLLKQLQLDDYTYNKIIDYIKKCNDHKHKREKRLSIESVINYLSIYYKLVNYFNTYIGAILIEFDAEYYTNIFGETERLNQEYKTSISKLKEELAESVEMRKLSEQDIITYKSIISEKDLNLLNLDDQNKKLEEQLIKLKDIKLNSMEVKLNKTIDMLNHLTNYLAENRIASSMIMEILNGHKITDEELKKKRIEMEKYE